jgi:Quinohemoprotein amine dehydrogenase, alpha subunit domain III
MRNRIGLLTLGLLGLVAMGCSDGGTTTVSTTGGSTTEPPADEASISAVIPNKVFLGRTVDVTISGAETKWTDTTKIDFGPGITVMSQTAASDTAIVATIQIADDAALGARDVTVTDADGTSTYKGAFKLESPLDLVLTGTQAQGSILVAKAKQLDLSTPFDDTSTGDGFFEPLVYTNMNVSGSQGINASVESVSLYSADLVLLLDVDTAAGKGDLTVNSGPLGDTLASPAPDSIDVAARMPEAVPEGGSIKGNIDAPLGSLLYSFTPSGPGLYSITATAASPDASPNVAVLPKSGRFAELLDFSAAPSILATNTDPFYLVYWDNSGASNYLATVSAKRIQTSDVEPNDTCAMAQAAGALPADIKDLFLASDKDVDWFAFDVAAGDVGKVVHVTTSPGDTKTDTVLEVFQSNCTTALGDPSDDSAYHEDLTTTPILAAGKHYVKVTNSTFGYTGKLYNLSIAIEMAGP